MMAKMPNFEIQRNPVICSLNEDQLLADISRKAILQYSVIDRC